MLKKFFCTEKNLKKIYKEIDKMNDFNIKISESVIKIINDIKKDGDKAIKKYIKKFDKVNIENLKITDKDIKNAYTKIDKKILPAIKVAIRNVKRFHLMQLQNLKGYIFKNEGYKIVQKYIPLDSAGIYIPGGQAPLFSTVVMACVPAIIAKVKRIVITSPPTCNNNINPYILVTADMLGIKEIYKVGGPMAVAALTYGTETILKVEKIVGPGNIYSTMAKKYVFGTVGIDGLNGPSEITILTDESANPNFVLLDLLSQAEHINGHSLLITTSQSIADFITDYFKNNKIEYDLTIIIVKDLKKGIELINYKAPEHLEIIVKKPGKIVNSIKNAPAIFVGNYSAVAFGDYIAGANHILPTNGTAKFSSALSVFDFIKHTHIVYCGKKALYKFGEKVEELAEKEGLLHHKLSIKCRRTLKWKK